MSYWLHSFDGLDLPLNLGNSGEHSLSAGDYSSPLVALPGGAYDPYGTEQVRPGARRYQARVMLVAASAAALKTSADAWLAKQGRRGTLVRQADDGTTEHTITARLVEAVITRAVGNRLWLPMRLTFETVEPVWSGMARDTTAAIDAEPTTVTVANGGNARVTTPVVTVTAAGSSITWLWVWTAGVCFWEYQGTIPVGQAVVVDCGARSVKLNGTADYAHFALSTTWHYVPDWLRLEPGNTTIYVQRTGGNNSSTVRFQFNDGWA